MEQLERYEERWNWRLRVERRSLLYMASPVTCGHGEELELLLLLLRAMSEAVPMEWYGCLWLILSLLNMSTSLVGAATGPPLTG